MRKFEKIFMTYGLYVKISCYKYICTKVASGIYREHFLDLLKTHFHFGSLGFETFLF